uniref:Uncharacterized protein n=1 Tax=Tanacetum cinerariifolium TaxID=118510 RepID=A0A6L2K8S2_TANCI|nr:hypothetical protein [Tanacetum cinerariifolium]
MTTTAAQQVVVNNALVPLEKRVEISKCNMRIDPAKTKKEPTYQVVLDGLALTTCYLTFFITADVPEIICISFGSPLTKKTILLTSSRLIRKDEKIVSFIKELGHKGDIKSINVVVIGHMH